MVKQPKLMNFSRMRNIFEPHLPNMREHLFINTELAILYGDPSVFRLIVQQSPPFSIDDHRLGIVVSGEAQVNLNLVEKHLAAGMLIFIGPGSIISPVSFSEDFNIYGIGLSKEFPLPFAPGQIPSAFNGQVRDFLLPVSEADITTARHIVDTLWHIVHQPCCNIRTVGSLVAAQMHHYDGLYQQFSDKQQVGRSREQTLFDRFIYLVNRYSQQEHQMGFYAGKMCLTERYLSTVVRQASGITGKEWIDRSIITRIKVELRHTEKSINQIADEMNFPNASFFCKYFKRLTGMTPARFRES